MQDFEDFIISGPDQDVENLDKLLQELIPATVSQALVDGEYLYRPDLDGTYRVRSMVDGFGSIIRTLLDLEGFQVHGKIKYSEENPWDGEKVELSTEDKIFADIGLEGKDDLDFQQVWNLEQINPEILQQLHSTYVSDYNGVKEEDFNTLLQSFGIDLSNLSEDENLEGLSRDERRLCTIKRKIKILRKLASFILTSDELPESVSNNFRLILICYVCEMGYKNFSMSELMELDAVSFYKELIKRAIKGRPTLSEVRRHLMEHERFAVKKKKPVEHTVASVSTATDLVLSMSDQENGKLFLREYVLNNDGLSPEAKDLLRDKVNTERGPWIVGDDFVNCVSQKGNKITVEARASASFYYMR